MKSIHDNLFSIPKIDSIHIDQDPATKEQIEWWKGQTEGIDNQKVQHLQSEGNLNHSKMLAEL